MFTVRTTRQLWWFVLTTGALICGLMLGSISLLAQIATMMWRDRDHDAVLLARSEIVLLTALQGVTLCAFYIAALALWRSTGGYCNGGCVEQQSEDDDE